MGSAHFCGLPNYTTIYINRAKFTRKCILPKCSFDTEMSQKGDIYIDHCQKESDEYDEGSPRLPLTPSMFIRVLGSAAGVCLSTSILIGISAYILRPPNA